MGRDSNVAMLRLGIRREKSEGIIAIVAVTVIGRNAAARFQVAIEGIGFGRNGGSWPKGWQESED